MADNNLTVALVLALVGLVIIIIYARSIEPSAVKISEIGATMAGKYVEISGTVGSASSNNGNVFLKVCGDACIPVVIFRGVASGMADPNPYIIKKGDRIVARGEVQEYEGDLELVVLREGDVEMG
ncbi:MAG: hypothetical protein NT157_04430 [Candidatus Micrarchaeota archaeon]|nr:hypothetical protein [Candidatus Micrarchaeota archaeon]